MSWEDATDRAPVVWSKAMGPDGEGGRGGGGTPTMGRAGEEMIGRSPHHCVVLTGVRVRGSEITAGGIPGAGPDARGLSP